MRHELRLQIWGSSDTRAGEAEQWLRSPKDMCAMKREYRRQRHKEAFTYGEEEKQLGHKSKRETLVEVLRNKNQESRVLSRF